MKLTEEKKYIRGVRRVAVVVVCAMVGVVTCGSALALSMRVNAASTSGESNASKTAEPIVASASAMAGNRLTGPTPKYPAAAKKAKIQGAVVLSVLIGKDGTVQNLKVISGPKELQESSLDAVRQWTYKPFLLNGNTVEVKTTISVIYSLKR